MTDELLMSFFFFYINDSEATQMFENYEQTNPTARDYFDSIAEIMASVTY